MRGRSSSPQETRCSSTSASSPETRRMFVLCRTALRRRLAWDGLGFSLMRGGPLLPGLVHRHSACPRGLEDRGPQEPVPPAVTPHGAVRGQWHAGLAVAHLTRSRDPSTPREGLDWRTGGGRSPARDCSPAVQKIWRGNLWWSTRAEDIPRRGELFRYVARPLAEAADGEQFVVPRRRRLHVVGGAAGPANVTLDRRRPASGACRPSAPQGPACRR